MTSPRPGPAPSVAPDASFGELASQLSEQTSRLVRDELALALAETKERGKKLGVGAGAFGATAVLAYFAVGVFIAAAVLGLAEAVDPWLSAVIVGVVLLLIAGVLALFGKKNVSSGAPPVPSEAIESVQTDVATVKQAVRR